MGIVSENMASALEMLPNPAGLYEWPCLGFAVAINRAAWELRGDRALGHGGDMPHLSDVGLDEVDVRNRLRVEDVYEVESALGILTMSVIPNMPQHARPDLMLITLYQGKSLRQARLDHLRIVTTLEVNESSEIAMRLLENTLQQVAAVLQTQREMLTSFNEHASRLISTTLYQDD